MATGSRTLADPTAALLWAGCRPRPDQAACDAARRAGADLDRAAEVAVTQRTAGLLWRVAQHWPADSGTWSDRLSRDAKRCQGQAALVRPRLQTHLLEPLHQAGLPPLVLKGAALAERYPAPGLRPMDDVDLLYPAEQRPAALEVLRRSGWRQLPRAEPHYAVSMVHPDLPGLPLDVHADISMPDERAFRLTVGDLWQRRQPTSLLGVPIFGLDPEVELVFLAIHAAKRFHTFDRLLWAVDAAVIIDPPVDHFRRLDWGVVGDLTRRASARSALCILLTQAARLGAQSPQWMRQLRGAKTRRRMLEPAMAEDWPLRQLDDSIRHRLTYALIDDVGLRLRWAAHEVSETGLERAPLHAASMAAKVVRRWWWLRRGRIG